MKKVFICILCLFVFGCQPASKEPLTPTQIVDGKSIVIPPEFDLKPTITEEVK